MNTITAAYTENRTDPFSERLLSEEEIFGWIIAGDFGSGLAASLRGVEIAVPSRPSWWRVIRHIQRGGRIAAQGAVTAGGWLGRSLSFVGALAVAADVTYGFMESAAAGGEAANSSAFAIVGGVLGAGCGPWAIACVPAGGAVGGAVGESTFDGEAFTRGVEVFGERIEERGVAAGSIDAALESAEALAEGVTLIPGWALDESRDYIDEVNPAFAAGADIVACHDFNPFKHIFGKDC